jgi:type I restriction enzyme S subunit
LETLRAVRVPCPPLDEQHQIVKQLLAAFGRFDRVAAETVRATALVDRLDEATLAKAFRGELVPQSPDDAAAPGFAPSGGLMTREITRG